MYRLDFGELLPLLEINFGSSGSLPGFFFPFLDFSQDVISYKSLKMQACN